MIPQESEIDALFFWNEAKIKEMINAKAKISPDAIISFNMFLPYWHKIEATSGKG